MQRLFWIIVITAAAIAPAAAWGQTYGAGKVAQPAAPAAKAVQVLVVTGVDLHAWRQTTPVLVAALQQDKRLETHVVEDAHFLDSAALDRYDVIVLHFMNWKVPAPGPAAQANLKRAVEAGKGLVLVHFACGTWQDWPEFKDLAGRVWDPKLRGHDPRGPFRVEIIKPDHPIVAGMKAFDTDDELYTCLAGDRPIEVLATAQSKVDKKTYPMAFVFTAGKGKVFHCVLGHDAKALAVPEVGELFRRGTAWTAGLAPVAK